MLYCDDDKYGRQAKFPLVEAFHAAVKERARNILRANGGDWEKVVFGAFDAGITIDDIKVIEQSILKLGYRYDWSASVSPRERPDAYKPVDGGDGSGEFMFRHPQAPKGEVEGSRQLCGLGDNVVRYPENISGIALYVRSPAQVLRYLEEGVPADTIAMIDDSGGTLTAPIIQQFKGVICAGGSTRSHLGILTREYGVPCLMNAKVDGIRNGDRVELEVSAPAKTAAAYQEGREMTANIWRLEA